MIRKDARRPIGDAPQPERPRPARLNADLFPSIESCSDECCRYLDVALRRGAYADEDDEEPAVKPGARKTP